MNNTIDLGVSQKLRMHDVFGTGLPLKSQIVRHKSSMTRSIPDPFAYLSQQQDAFTN